MKFVRHDALLRHIKEQTPCVGCNARFQRRKGKTHHLEGCPFDNADGGLHNQGPGAVPVAMASSLPIPTDDVNSSASRLLPCDLGCVKEDGNRFFEMSDLIEHMFTMHVPEEQRPQVLNMLQQGVTSQSSQSYVALQPTQPLLGPNDASQSNEPGYGTQYVQLGDVFWSAAAPEDYEMFQGV